MKSAKHKTLLDPLNNKSFKGFIDSQMQICLHIELDENCYSHVCDATLCAINDIQLNRSGIKSKTEREKLQ